LLALLAAGVAVWLMMGGTRLARAVPPLCLLTAVAVTAWLYQYLKLPPRVYLPAFAAFPAAALAGAAGPRGWRDLHPAARPWDVAVLALLGALLALRTAFDLWESADNRARHARALDMMAQLAPRPDQLFVVWGADLPFEDVVFPLRPTAPPPGLEAVGFGWMTRAPFTRRRLDEFGVADLYRALYERDDVRLVCTPARAQLLCSYLHERYGVRVEPRVTFAHPGLREAEVYRICRP
jgi:hypothetical protein